ncbi:MAG: inorganic phosphate transporter [Bacteroidales bacterium]|nr:inorganic phosphate transporter [Bacteroidales bacterium]MBN2761747.1 inorganic phosphate transporter [Bacteroidales bacterium]
MLLLHDLLMIDIYFIIVLVLAGLALSDLIVGVSNDAVNFLNSAIGSKAASFKVALAVAAVGILAGTAFSGGMMEVARKSIFNPSQFVFSEIMIIFLAVMLTDVLLLDFFNTFGLPTSTTVSLVFELLGASVGVTLIKISRTVETMQDIGKYINSGRTLLIIAGILLSVVVAFTVGLIIQFVARLIFSFDYRKTLRYFGSVFGGIALTAIIYFVLIEGARGVTFISEESIVWIHENTHKVLLLTFLGGSFLLQILTWVFNLNVFKFTVLLGTGALALAFAGNDLVNFIGVPLAGIESYNLFNSAVGVDPDGFLMTGLQAKVKTPTIFLMITGVVMVITLYMSKKARGVVKTSLNLSNQEETIERFESSILARSFVRMALSMGSFFERILPQRVLFFISKRLDPEYFQKSVKDKSVSFDLVRASVNLVVASILIAFGTSQKLPLSTTYVTFMVAMGTSLADGAWSRETAVYRVNGVITVIAGWFFTALIAFVCASIVAMILYFGGLIALIVLIASAFFLVYRTHVIHARRSAAFEKSEAKLADTALIDGDRILLQCNKTISNTLVSVIHIYEAVIKGWIDEKRKKLKNALQDSVKLSDEIRELQENVFYTIKKLRVEESVESGHQYVQVIEHLRDISESLNYICNPIFKHVDNNHAPLKSQQIRNINEFTGQFISFLNQIRKAIEGKEIDKAINKSNMKQLLDMLLKMKKDHLKMIKSGQTSTRISLLFMDVLTESRNLVLEISGLCDDALAFAEYSGKKKSDTELKGSILP